MTNEKLTKVFQFYDAELTAAYSATDHKPTRYCGNRLGESDLLAELHAWWMVRTVLGKFDPVADHDKGQRWLGFVQGLLWCSGKYTIDEMKDHNRQEQE